MISVNKSLVSVFSKAVSNQSEKFPISIGDFIVKGLKFNYGSLVTESDLLGNDCFNNYLLLNVCLDPEVNLLIHYYPSESSSAVKILESYVGRSLNELVLKGGRMISKIKSHAFIRYANGPIDLVAETSDFKFKSLNS